MVHARLVGVLIVALATPFSPPQKPPSQAQAVWFWSVNCGQKRQLKIEVLLGGETLYESSFAVCQAKERPIGSKARTIVFHFKGGYVFQGKYRTSPLETVEGNIWQAGANPDAILLGVSFSNKKQILLNTIHIAKPEGESASEVDDGLRVRTIPQHD